MTQAVSAMKTWVGGGSWMLVYVSETRVTVFKWRAPLFACIGVLEILRIQNLELVGGKGKGRVQHINTIHLFSDTKCPTVGANHTFRPRPSHPYSEWSISLNETPLGNEIVATLCWFWQDTPTACRRFRPKVSSFHKMWIIIIGI